MASLSFLSQRVQLLLNNLLPDVFAVLFLLKMKEEDLGKQGLCAWIHTETIKLDPTNTLHG